MSEEKQIPERPEKLNPMSIGKRTITVSYGIKATSGYVEAAEKYMDSAEAQLAAVQAERDETWEEREEYRREVEHWKSECESFRQTAYTLNEEVKRFCGPVDERCPHNHGWSECLACRGEEIVDDFIPLSHAQAEMSSIKAQLAAVTKERDVTTGNYALSMKTANRDIEQLRAKNASLREENDRLRGCVESYGRQVVSLRAALKDRP